MSEPRDMQRERLYVAERQSIRGKGKNFADLAEAQAYVDHLVASAWFRRRWSIKRIRVTHSPRARRATAWSWQMRVDLPSSRWAWTEDVILHEVAHLTTDWNHPRSTIQAHGREFAADYVELVAHKMGRTAAALLKAAFIERRVKFTKPRAKRVLTPEQKAALVERLAAARAAKVAKAA